MPKSLFEEIPSALTPQRLFLRKGDKLFEQGGSASKLYFIETGKIKLIRNTVDGTPVILHIGQQGEAVAEASLFSDLYHCSAIADSDSKISFIKKADLLAFLETNPKSMMSLLAVFSRQVRDLRAINEIKNIRAAGERILAFIRCNVDDNKEFKLTLSLKDIAHNIGLAHETFYRELKKLEKSGKIQRDSSRIKLL